MKSKWNVLLIILLVLVMFISIGVAISIYAKPKELSEKVKAIIHADSQSIDDARDIALKDTNPEDTPIVTDDVTSGIKECPLLSTLINFLSTCKKFRHFLVAQPLNDNYILDGIFQKIAINMTLGRNNNYKELEEVLIEYISDGKTLSKEKIQEKYDIMLDEYFKRQKNSIEKKIDKILKERVDKRK